MSEKKRFSIVARVRSANHAWRGIRIVAKTSHNFLGHLFFAVLAIYLGFELNISSAEWGLLVLSMFTVLAAETFNSAIEIDIDLTSPNYHPYARDTKDIAAGAVVLTIIGAVVVGLIIFLPKILHS